MRNCSLHFVGTHRLQKYSTWYALKGQWFLSISELNTKQCVKMNGWQWIKQFGNAVGGMSSMKVMTPVYVSCHFPLVSKSCLFLPEKRLSVFDNWLFLVRRIKLLFYSLFNNGSNNTGYYCQYYKKNNNVLFFCTLISPIYTFFLAGNIIVHRPSQGTNREKYFYKSQHHSQNSDHGGK